MCMCVCVYVCVYACMYVYIHIPTPIPKTPNPNPDPKPDPDRASCWPRKTPAHKSNNCLGYTRAALVRDKKKGSRSSPVGYKPFISYSYHHLPERNPSFS